jgi:hypothetical protein
MQTVDFIMIYMTSGPVQVPLRNSVRKLPPLAKDKMP